MKSLIPLLFAVIFSTEFILSFFKISSRIFALMPEFMSLLGGLYLVLFFAFGKHLRIQWRYFIFFLMFLVHIAIGLIGNQVQPLAVLAGLRTYLKYIPFYLLPAVYEQPYKDIQSQMKVLLYIALLQFPISLYQRFFEYHFASGDYVSGTLVRAPSLTIFLVSSLSVLIAFYLKKQLTTKTFVLLLLLMFIPTTINETKSTVILLPVAVLVPIMFEIGKQNRLRIMLGVIPLFALMLVSFHIVYKMVYSKNTNVLQFYTTSRISNYLYKGTDISTATGEEGEIGRIDSIIIAYKESATNLFRLFWGVGAGNAALSFSRKFQGDYTEEYMRLNGKMTTVSHFIWETGLLGISLVFLFFIMIFFDALKLRTRNDIVGTLSLGWLGVAAIMALSLPYQNIIANNALSYTFLYFSGYLSSERIHSPASEIFKERFKK